MGGPSKHLSCLPALVFHLSCMGQDADGTSPLVFGLCGQRFQCLFCACRSFFFSFILQARFNRPSINDTYDPGGCNKTILGCPSLHYYILSCVNYDHATGGGGTVQFNWKRAGHFLNSESMFYIIQSMFSNDYFDQAVVSQDLQFKGTVA
jgi:hypothetical protein